MFINLVFLSLFFTGINLCSCGFSRQEDVAGDPVRASLSIITCGEAVLSYAITGYDNKALIKGLQDRTNMCE